jgi:hypothetical protein
MGRFIVAAAVAAALFVHNSPAFAEGVGGTLAGSVTQSDNNATYAVDMELYGSRGSINYPSLRCGGTISFVRAAGGTFWYQESITYGTDKCINGGMIQISPSPFKDPTSWNWRWDGSGISVRGVLTGSAAVKP